MLPDVACDARPEYRDNRALPTLRRDAGAPKFDYAALQRRDAPEIDGMVLIPGDAPIGEIVPVRVTGAMEYDLVGEVIS